LRISREVRPFVLQGKIPQFVTGYIDCIKYSNDASRTTERTRLGPELYFAGLRWLSGREIGEQPRSRFGISRSEAS
jgi:hypothetical protein